MITSCGLFPNQRRTREKCPICIFGRKPNCPCPGCEKGLHWLPGTQRNESIGKFGLKRVVDAGIRHHKERRDAA